MPWLHTCVHAQKNKVVYYTLQIKNYTLPCVYQIFVVPLHAFSGLAYSLTEDAQIINKPINKQQTVC